MKIVKSITVRCATVGIITALLAGCQTSVSDNESSDESKSPVANKTTWKNLSTEEVKALYSSNQVSWMSKKGKAILYFNSDGTCAISNFSKKTRMYEYGDDGSYSFNHKGKIYNSTGVQKHVKKEKYRFTDDRKEKLSIKPNPVDKQEKANQACKLNE